MIRALSLLPAAALMLNACATPDQTARPEASAMLDRMVGQVTGFIDGVADGCVAPMLAGKTIAQQYGETGPFRREVNAEARDAAGLKEGDTVWRVAEAGPGVTIIESGSGCTVSVMNVPAVETGSTLASVLVARHQFTKPELGRSSEPRSMTARQSTIVDGRQLDVLVISTQSSGDFANLMATVTWKE